MTHSFLIFQLHHLKRHVLIYHGSIYLYYWCINVFTVLCGLRDYPSKSFKIIGAATNTGVKHFSKGEIFSI